MSSGSLLPGIYVLYHRACGHIGGATGTRSVAEARRKLFAAAGYHQWRVRVGIDADLEALLEGRRCATCTIDPSRGLLPATQLEAARQMAGGT
jgi:hypothetical protein